jgi:NAD(P)H-dependent FMN reductase
MASLPRLVVVIASTRPVRVGPSVAEWFAQRARARARFELELVDLKAVALPLLDEEKHPRLGEYAKAHTKRWSATVKAADAFVFVTPEYNTSGPPALVNALDYLYQEWNYKPAAFVSYGGISAGTRAVQALKLMLCTLKMVPIVEAVAIPFVTNHVVEGRFRSTDAFDRSADLLLDELRRWSDALVALRG